MSDNPPKAEEEEVVISTEGATIASAKNKKKKNKKKKNKNANLAGVDTPTLTAAGSHSGAIISANESKIEASAGEELTAQLKKVSLKTDHVFWDTQPVPKICKHSSSSYPLTIFQPLIFYVVFMLLTILPSN
jgi:hypothetical protein